VATRHVGVGLADDGTPIWQPVPDEYAIGFPRDLRNGAGGVAIALRMQDPNGSRYLAFHQRMFGEPGPNDKSRALSVAKELGFDPVRLEKDMASDEVEATLSENAKLAKDLGLTGTPSYVVGDAVVGGAVGWPQSRKRSDPRASRPTKRTSSALGAPVRITPVEGGVAAARAALVNWAAWNLNVDQTTARRGCSRSGSAPTPFASSNPASAS
jgi:hypothetical protein